MAKRFRHVMGRNSEIYVISDGHGWVKIGFSVNPLRRLMSLQVANPYKLKLITSIRVNDGALVERRVHTLLAKAKRQGEWFNVDPIDALIAVTKAMMMRPRRNNTIAYATERGQRTLPCFTKIARLGDKAYELQ